MGGVLDATRARKVIVNSLCVNDIRNSEDMI